MNSKKADDFHRPFLFPPFSSLRGGNADVAIHLLAAHLFLDCFATLAMTMEKSPLDNLGIISYTTSRQSAPSYPRTSSRAFV